MKKLFLPIVAALMTMMSVSSCFGIDDIGMHRPNYNPGDEYDINKVMFYQNPDWKIDYRKRYPVFEEGRDIYVDKFTVTSRNNMTYYMDLISEKDLRENFGGDITTRIKDQAINLYKDDQEGYLDLDEVLMHGTNDIDFNRLQSGYWYAYCFGMWNDGKISGDYQVVQFKLNAERPVNEYLNWLGEWKIGDHKTQYTIQVKQDEPNYSYAITGWESSSPDAEDYVILTDFDRKNGNMLFYNQILGDFKDNDNNWYDIMFCGSFYYKNANGQVDDILAMIGPSTIAKASFELGDEREAKVEGLISNVELDGQNYPFTFNFMHFKDVPEREDLPLLSYNDIVPELPYKMERVRTRSAEDMNYEHEAKAIRHQKAETKVRKIK